MRISILFLICFMFTGCSDGVFSSEVPTLKENNFIDVYEQVLFLENYYQAKYGAPIAYKNALDKSCQKVFLKHQVSREDYEKTYDYYAHRPEKMKYINEQVIARLNKRKLDN
jgi:hypothetical protein